MPREPFGVTTFCDDIRHEVGGLVSLIGVYREVMILQGVSFPVTLRKFALYVKYIEPLELVIAPIDLRVFLPGDPDDTPSVRHTWKPKPEADLLSGPDFEPGEEKTRVRILVTELAFSPLVLQQAGRIKVRAVRPDGATAYLGQLFVQTGEVPA
jgi:hypothetical protein